MKAICILLAVTAAAVVLLFFVCGFIFNQLVWRKTVSIPRWITDRIAGNAMPDAYEKKNNAAVAAFSQLPIRSVELHTPDGARLAAKVLTPEKPNGRLLIACHGARSNGTGEFALMAPYLYKKGYTVLFPDHRGCGESDGKYMGYGTHESRDTLLWLDYAKIHYPDLPVFLLGVSMGGATVLMMSDKVNPAQVKGIIADCAYTSAWAEFRYQLRCHSCRPVPVVATARVHLLFFSGHNDDFAPFFMRDQLYNACPTEKAKLTVPAAVHARSYYTDPTAYQLALERFTENCLAPKA